MRVIVVWSERQELVCELEVVCDQSELSRYLLMCHTNRVKLSQIEIPEGHLEPQGSG